MIKALMDYLSQGRFESFICKLENGCWEWLGSKRKGYGRFRYKGLMVSAHRLAFEQVKGEISDGLQLDHLCRNHACVNPDHLELVINQENCRRGNTGLHNALKTHCPKGHPYNTRNTHLSYSKNGVAMRNCRICRANSARIFLEEKQRRELCVQ